jgi:hypothetical protein
MGFYVQLQHATDIQRDADGQLLSYRTGWVIASFRQPEAFLDYVRQHASELPDTVAFSGSAGLNASANNFLFLEQRKAGVA